MYLFFVRAFNDIDHTTPVVWKMSRDNYPVAVYCINPEYDIENDYRLNFLKEMGITVDFIYREFDQHLGHLHHFMRFLFFKIFAYSRRLDSPDLLKSTFLSRIARGLTRKVGIYLYKLTRTKFYNANWAGTILDQSGARALCFDWIMPENYVVEVLLKEAEKRSIPTLSLPHGVSAFSNDLVKTGATKARRFDKFNRYDYVIVQNESRKEFVARSGVCREKILVLGSSRYCEEWMRQNNRILPRTLKASDENGGQLRVVLMTTRFDYRVKVERMFKTIDLLSSFNGMEIVIKPHTRTGWEAHLFEDLPLSNVSSVLTAELCEWADVVLVIATSVTIEALIQGKPVLYLKYLHENTTLYEEFEACWTIHNDVELRDALLSLHAEKSYVPYTNENVNEFLTEIIYGGQSQRNVLEDYEKFIVNTVNNRRAEFSSYG